MPGAATRGRRSARRGEPEASLEQGRDLNFSEDLLAASRACPPVARRADLLACADAPPLAHDVNGPRCRERLAAANVRTRRGHDATLGHRRLERASEPRLSRLRGRAAPSGTSCAFLTDRRYRHDAAAHEQLARKMIARSRRLRTLRRRSAFEALIAELHDVVPSLRAFVERRRATRRAARHRREARQSSASCCFRSNLVRPRASPVDAASDVPLPGETKSRASSRRCNARSTTTCESLGTRARPTTRMSYPVRAIDGAAGPTWFRRRCWGVPRAATRVPARPDKQPTTSTMLTMPVMPAPTLRFSAACK